MVRALAADSYFGYYINFNRNDSVCQLRKEIKQTYLSILSNDNANLFRGQCYTSLMECFRQKSHPTQRTFKRCPYVLWLPLRSALSNGGFITILLCQPNNWPIWHIPFGFGLRYKDNGIDGNIDAVISYNVQLAADLIQHFTVFSHSLNQGLHHSVLHNYITSNSACRYLTYRDWLPMMFRYSPYSAIVSIRFFFIDIICYLLKLSENVLSD